MIDTQQAVLVHLFMNTRFERIWKMNSQLRQKFAVEVQQRFDVVVDVALAYLFVAIHHF